MNRRNRVAFFNILSTVLLRGISIFTAPLFTRLLGTSGYGVTQIYNTWVAVIAIVFTLQTQGTLVNARVEYPEGDQLRYQSSAMSLSTLVYLIFSALVLCFIGPISGALKLSWFLIVLMLIQGFGTFCVNFLNTKFVYEFKAGRNMVMSLVVTLTTLILSIVLILLLPKQINYLGRISAIAVTYGVLGIPVCIWILAKGKTFYNKEYWKFCVVLAIPAVFYNLSDLILGQSDKVMLQQMMDEATVGCYGAAVATLISHSLQLTLHYLYVRFALGGKEYPFPLKMWVGYAAVFAAVAVASVAADGLWLARWGLGAAVGLWELLRIRKRKVLI